MSNDLMRTLFEIAKAGAQKHAAQPDPVACEDCDEPATESWAIPTPPFAEHYCERCAERRRTQHYERSHHDLPRAESD